MRNKGDRFDFLHDYSSLSRPSNVADRCIVVFCLNGTE